MGFVFVTSIARPRQGWFIRVDKIPAALDQLELNPTGCAFCTVSLLLQEHLERKLGSGYILSI